MLRGDQRHREARISLELNRAHMSSPGELTLKTQRKRQHPLTGVAKELLKLIWFSVSSNQKAISHLKASQVATGQSFLWDETKET